MSGWRRRELEPITEALMQVSQLVGSSCKTHSTADAFSESLQHLQAVHDQQVSTLSREVARLRNEVDVLSKGPKDVDFVVGPCEDPGVPLRLAKSDPQLLQWATRRAKTDYSLPRLAIDPVRSKTKQSASSDSKQSTPRGGGGGGGGLSVEVSQGISQHLNQFKSEKSVRSAMHRISSVGSTLLSEYVTYRRSHLSGSEGWAQRLVSSPKFDLVMGAIIVLNAIPIGLEASISRTGQEVPLILHVSEYVFLAVYTLELCLRFAALGRRALCSSWVVFDVFLVCCGCLDLATIFFGAPRIFENVVLVRTFRLARLARMLRLMIKFNTLWMLVQGLMNSLMTLTWTCIIICILLFVFAVLGLELLQPDPMASEEYNRIASENFGSLLKAATTLLQGLTLDSFGVIYRPVMLERPLTIFYFVPFLLVVSIALMNLVTALMVNFSLEQAMKDKQLEEQIQTEQRAEVIRILERAFDELDTNHSGCVDLPEMLAAPEELRTLICEVAKRGEGGQADVKAIFRTLDFDSTGYVKIEDFCQGLLMLHDHKALESYFVMKHCARMMNKVMFRHRSEGGYRSPSLDEHKSDLVSPTETESIIEENTTRL